MALTPIPQAEVTPEMTAWAVELLHDEAGHPMGSSDSRAFGSVHVVARVEVHTNGTAQNPAPHDHRGISLYEDDQADEDPTPVQHTGPAIGIDVSGHQDKPLDWGQVAAAGYSFAFIKASEGLTVTDEMLEQHWRGAKAAGLLVGGYHFFRARDPGAAQARHLADALSNVGDAYGAPDLPPALDVELDDHDALGVAAEWAMPIVADRTADALKAMADRFGRKPLLYTMTGFWSRLPDRGYDWAALADLWVANFTQKPQPLMPHGWQDWRFWQWSETTMVPGYATKVDGNRFAGTEDELRAYAANRLAART